MASTYCHVGDVKDIPADAPPALHFLASFVPAMDGSSHEARMKHFSPTATIKTNAGAALPFVDLHNMFEMRDQMTEKFWHAVNRVWLVADGGDKVTVLMDWSSTTILNHGTDHPAFVPEFSVLKLVPGEGGRGVHGLVVDTIENWMDPSPVEKARDEIVTESESE